MNKHIKGKYSWVKHLDFILLDIFSLLISYPIAFFIRYQTFKGAFDGANNAILVICCLLDLVLILFSGIFSGIFRRNGTEEFIKTVVHVLNNFIIACILVFLLIKGSGYSKTVLCVNYGIYFVISYILRFEWKKLIQAGKAKSVGNSQKTIVVVGMKDEMPTILRGINSGFFKEYDIKGLCVPDAKMGEVISGRVDIMDKHGKVKETYESFANVTTLDNLADYVVSNNVEEVFIGINPGSLSQQNYQKLIANAKGIHMDIEPMIGFKTDDQFITTIGTFKTLSVGAYSFTSKQMMYLVIKRLIDILFGIIGLICMLPLMLVIKISYLLSGDKESIFYMHTRIGLNGKPFKMYKFRSMVCNADEVLKAMLKDPKYKKEWDEYQKFENDPRITRIGKFLRNTSLDEIPQFINVLKGDMSLIGPRPLVPDELQSHGGLQLYNTVRPGVTGWWGCNGRSNTTYDERLELEYYYIKHCSLYLDIYCIEKTIVAILKHDGAQ